MKVALAFLTERVRYEVPRQDLRLPLSRIAAAPNSRFVIANLHAR